MDADARELFATSLRHVTAANTGDALDAALGELGWGEALPADRRTAVSLLFELQGAAGATSSALDAVILETLGLGLEGDLGVVLPPLGRTDPPGSVEGEGVRVGGLALAGVAARDRAVVITGTGEGSLAAVVDTAELKLRAVHGLDPRLGIVEVTGAHVPATARSDLPRTAWPAAVAAGQRALAHELVGASRTMLGLAREHALERVQFGRPIASFQAVRHRLAEAYVAIEAADAALAAAWVDGTPFTAAMAKAIAGRSARTVSRHCQQVLAGIGFTTEHDLHLYVRRVIVLDRLLGGARSLTRRLGEDLLERRSLPSILPL
ncbi:MAG TPA: acyl-CoA dehydrogenase family protein [Acidimicrobiales bacterium]|jgi:alkylation response protein AidB-like acyl-CoA dehydrogenase|nr:acyl-CoA dehydrogenase family protein [Acidimicrobiales bacterium]